jgi:hypothetical protein
MTDAYNAGRAAGIREAAEVAREIADQYVGYMSRIERAILALLDSPAPAGVTIKPLVWMYHPEGTIAAPPTGHAYIIDTRMKGRAYSIKGFNPAREFESKDEAKAAAQADYEARIMAALEPLPCDCGSTQKSSFDNSCADCGGELYQAAKRDAEEAEAYAAELGAKLQNIVLDCLAAQGHAAENFQMYVDANEARIDAEAKLVKSDVAALEKILNERGRVFDAMVEAAEDAAERDVSFNVVVGRALRAALKELKGEKND